MVVGLGAKDAFAQRGRTALTVSSLALAAALVATAMGFEATMDRLGSDSALRAQPYELSVESALPPAQVDGLLERTPGVTAVARIREIVLTARDKTEIHARVLDGPLGAFPYAIPDGRAARAPGEVTPASATTSRCRSPAARSRCTSSAATSSPTTRAAAP